MATADTQPTPASTPAPAPIVTPYTCLVEKCSHGAVRETPNIDSDCGAAILAGLITRRGDPKVFLEIPLLCKLFRVKPLRAVHPYGAWKESNPEQKYGIVDYLKYLHPGTETAVLRSMKYFDGATDAFVEANMMAFECMLSSMGLRFAGTPDRWMQIVSDDPTIDYGYGPGAAVKFRQDTWIRNTSIAEGESQEAIPMRAIALIMLGVVSIGRPDLAIELMSCLFTERSKVVVVDVPGLQTASDTSADAIHAISGICFASTASPVFSRVLLSVMGLLAKGVRRMETAQPASGAESLLEPKTYCDCGLSTMRLRVRGTSDPEEGITIEMCPYSAIWKGDTCKKWSVAARALPRK